MRALRKIKKISKIFFLFVIMGSLVLVGFGCKGGVSKQQQAATRPVSLEFWTVADDVDALQTEIDQFRATRPYLTINLRQLHADELYPRLLEALAEDRGPDIVSVNNRFLRAFQTKLAPMPASYGDAQVFYQKNLIGGTDTIVQTHMQALPTPLQIEREYIKAVKGDIVLGGNIYGLPLSADDMAIFYNRDLLDKSGIAAAPKTWKDFQDDVKKIVKIDKPTGKILQAGAAIGTGALVEGFDDLLYILFEQSGVNFTDDKGYAVFNTMQQGESAPSPVKVMDFYTDFANSGRDTFTWNDSLGDSQSAFVSGKVGFFLGYSSDYQAIKARAPQLNIEMIPMLQLNPEAPVNAANYWVQTVTAKSKHQNEAWGLLDYLAHSQATKDYLDKSGRPSAMRAFVATQSLDPKLAPFMSQILVSENWYRGRGYIASLKALDELIVNWIKDPPQTDMTVNDWKDRLLNTAAAKVNQTL